MSDVYVRVPYAPAAISTVVMAGESDCPGCGESVLMRHGIMGTGDPLLCGRCFDDVVFAGRPALRAEMETKRDLLFSGVRHLLDRVTWAEAA